MDTTNLFFIAFKTVLYILFVYLAYFTIRLYFTKRKYSHIPGPKSSSFIFGNLRPILKQIKKGRLYMDYVMDCFENYGPVYKTELFNRVFVSTIDPNAIKEALVSKSFPKEPKFVKVIAYPHNFRFLGTGIMTETNNQTWKCKRASFQTFFNRQNFENFVSIFDSKTDLLIRRLSNMADGQTVFSFKTEISHLILDSIAKIFFGMELDSLNDSENDFNTNIKIAVHGLLECHKDPFMTINPYKWAYLKKFKSAIDFLRKIAKEEIEKRIKKIKNDEYVPQDFLSIMVENKHELDMEQAIDDFITFFVSGQETTSIAVSFCLMELGRNPPILKKVAQEVDEVIGLRQIISLDDLQKMSYLGQVLSETLRLWPPVPTLNRVTNIDMEINGIFIPKKTEIEFSIYSAGRSKEYFEEPLEFRPERFTNGSNQNPINPYTYFPFSLGPRNCLGQNFALLEMKLILAKIIQNYEFKLDSNQSFEAIFTGNLIPKDGVKCTLKLRD